MRAKGETSMLVLGHPGHELRLHGWLEQARPVVCVLTDGAGAAAAARATFSREMIDRVGGRVGPVFGQRTDRAWYQAILSGQVEPFVEAVREMLAIAWRLNVTLIVSDARDGYNPMHDAAFDMARLVTARLVREGRDVRHLVFPVTEMTAGAPAWIGRLSPDAVARKEAALARYAPLASEIHAARAHGAFDCGLEQLFEVAHLDAGAEPPFYESVGRSRVSSGEYATMIERRRHYLPLMEAVAEAVASLPVGEQTP